MPLSCYYTRCYIQSYYSILYIAFPFYLLAHKDYFHPYGNIIPRPFHLSNKFCLSMQITMEMIDLSGKFLLQAMFEKLDLPHPHYYVRALEQGGYRSDIEFYPSTELLHHGCKPVSITSSVCKDRASSLNNVAGKAVSYMGRRCQKVLVDYNYTKLQQAQDINASLTDSVTQKDKVIKEQKQQIRELSMEWSDYLDEVWIASDQIHQLSATGLDPNTQVTSHRLKKALAELHDKIVALQQLTGMSSLSLQRKVSCPYGGESASAYDGASVDDLPDGYNASD